MLNQNFTNMNITLPNGYQMTTTFFQDFGIAEAFGLNAVEDTFENAFNSWKHDYVYLTELAIVMSNNSIAHYNSNRELAFLYSDLYHKVDNYCMNKLKGEALNFYLRATD